MTPGSAPGITPASVASGGTAPAIPCASGPATASEDQSQAQRSQPDLPPHLSWSQIDTMRRCPRKFAYVYVEQAEPEFIASSLLFGSALHTAIEAHYQALLDGQPLGREQLMAIFQDHWQQGDQRFPDIPVKFNKNEDEAGLSERARGMLDALLASDIATPQGEILAIEERARVTLRDDLPPLVARLDLIWHDAEAVHVVDFKTARSRWGPEKVREGADQLNIYHRAAQPLANSLDLPLKLHFAVLTKAKKPAAQVLDVPAIQEGDDRLIQTVEQVWSAMKAGNFYANPSPMNCSTCPFRKHCPAHAGTDA